MQTQRANIKIFFPLLLAVITILSVGLFFLFTDHTPEQQYLPPEEWDAVTQAKVLEQLEIADEAATSGQLDQAESIAKQLHEEQPLDPRSLRILIRVEKRRSIEGGPQHTEAAIGYAREALALKPEDPEYHFGLAHLLSGTEAKDVALTHFLKAYELNPDDHRFSFFTARLYHHLEQYDDAERFYLLSLKANENNHQTYEGLALMAVQREDYLEAADLLKEAITLLPEATTDSQTAFAEREKYLPAYGMARARYFIKAGQPKSALHTLALLPTELPAESRKQIFILTAEAYEADKQFKAAAEMWAEISAQQRLDAAAAARAGLAYFKLGELDIAKNYLKIGMSLKAYDPYVQELNDVILAELEKQQNANASTTQPE